MFKQNRSQKVQQQLINDIVNDNIVDQQLLQDETKIEEGIASMLEIPIEAVQMWVATEPVG